MKLISIRLLLCFSLLFMTKGHSQQIIMNNQQDYITIRVVDELDHPLEHAEVTIKGILEAPGLSTDINGEVFISMLKYQIIRGQVLRIEIRLESYYMIDGIYEYTVKDPSLEPNFVIIRLHKYCNYFFRFISLNNYIKKNSKFSFGFGLGYLRGDNITIRDLPSEMRTVPPHPDDVLYRLGDILDPANPDNYLIIKNTADIALKCRISLEVNFRFLGILNIAVQTSATKGSEVVEGENFYRKSYIKENAVGGDALIYYLIKSKERSFLHGNSISLPVYVTYPVICCGKNENVIFHFLGGTNVLLPAKITFEAEKGWHRFNERQMEGTFDLGELKETEFFSGISIEGAPTNSTRFNIQFLLVYSEYHANFSVPQLSLQQTSKVLPSLKLNFCKLFNTQ